MMSGFYRPRWERFFDTVAAAMEAGTEYDEDAFIEESKCWEWEWTFGKEEYDTVPVGSAVDACLGIRNKYSEDIMNSQDNFQYEAVVEAYV